MSHQHILKRTKKTKVMLSDVSLSDRICFQRPASVARKQPSCPPPAMGPPRAPYEAERAGADLSCCYRNRREGSRKPALRAQSRWRGPRASQATPDLACVEMCTRKTKKPTRNLAGRLVAT